MLMSPEGNYGRPADPAGRAARLNERLRSSGTEGSDAMSWGDVKWTRRMRAPHPSDRSPP
jgi:hypothetical protein